jgi:hypothetical protein
VSGGPSTSATRRRTVARGALIPAAGGVRRLNLPGPIGHVGTLMLAALEARLLRWRNVG